MYGWGGGLAQLGGGIDFGALSCIGHTCKIGWIGGGPRHYTVTIG